MLIERFNEEQEKKAWSNWISDEFFVFYTFSETRLESYLADTITMRLIVSITSIDDLIMIRTSDLIWAWKILFQSQPYKKIMKQKNYQTQKKKHKKFNLKVSKPIKTFHFGSSFETFVFFLSFKTLWNVFWMRRCRCRRQGLICIFLSWFIALC